MDRQKAEQIAKQISALKHINKKLNEIEKTGSTIVRLNCTGVEFVVKKDDALYFKLKTKQAELTENIKSYEIVAKTPVNSLTNV